MPGTLPPPMSLSSKQEAELSFMLEEDPDQWLVLLVQFIALGKEASGQLKTGMLNNTPEWQKMAAETRERGFEDLKQMALTRVTKWNVWLRQLLSDPDQIVLFDFYLRSIVNLKKKRVVGFSFRAKTQQQINNALSAIGNAAFICLERYQEALYRLDSGIMANKMELTPVARAYYEESYNDHLKQISWYLALIVMIRSVSSNQDVDLMRQYIRTNIIRPMEARKSMLKGKDAQQLQDRIESYYRLMEVLNITYE